MATILFWVGIGAFIGWNIPQPTWAKRLQNKVVEAFQKTN